MEGSRTTAPWRLLDWDTRFFGLRIARLDLSSDAEVDGAMQWLREEAVELCYALVPCDQVTLMEHLQRHDFAFRDVRMELSLKLSQTPVDDANPGRPVIAEDMPALLNLAESAHQNTRFFKEPAISKERAGALYREWLNKSVQAPNCDVFTLDVDEEPAGYVTLARKGTEGTLGLVAVEPRFRKQGVTTRLVAAALHQAAVHGLESISVVTQGDNAAALRIYERAGFTIQAVGLWLHWRSPNLG